MSSSFHKQHTMPNLTFLENTIEPIPKEIGPYKVKSLFNKGGMSILYLGIDKKTHKPIVIKVLSPKFLKNQEVVENFLKEAKIISLSNHPNIINLHDQGTWEKGLYIAMEFIRGISLRQFIEQRAFSTKKALEIILQVAYALSHLHSHKVIHRDLKPENILITESGDIKVIDFGIAQIKKDINISKNKKIMGTPVYMSPEQKKDPENVSYTADIFSLGVITYELILGRLSHGVIQLSLLPKSFRKILEKALKTDPKERYQDIVEFITDISEYLKISSKKPELKEEYLDEIIRSVDKFQKLLIPSIPNWPNIDVSLSTSKGTGLYLDFFKLSERYITLIAEPINLGVDSINHIASLRGMIKATIHHSFEKEDFHLTSLLNTLNKVIYFDPINQLFFFSILMCIPEKSKFVFSSCGFDSLVHKGKLISTPNPFLGKDEHALFVETAGNWNVSDKLILSSSAFSKKEHTLKQEIEDTSLFPTKVQIKKIIENLSHEKSDRAKALICLERIS